MAQPVKPFTHPVGVRYLEVDAQGVVFNMWYLGWFDDAMTAFLAARGVPYPELMAGGHDVQLVRSEIDWTAGVAFADDVAVEVEPERVGTTSFTLRFTVRRDGEATAVGRTTYVVIGLEDGGKQPIPAELRGALDGGSAR